VIVGDYTTSYILHPLAPQRIYTHLPETKVIVLLRNPIDRAYSHYVMSKRANIESLPFETIIETELEEIEPLLKAAQECFEAGECDPTQCFPDIALRDHSPRQLPFLMKDEKKMKDYYFTSYLFRSIYADSMARWLHVFPRDQILILQSEEMYNNTVQVMEQVTTFLELPYFDWSSADILDSSWGGGASNKIPDPHQYEPMDPATRVRLREFFAPYNQQLYQLLGVDYGWE